MQIPLLSTQPGNSLTISETISHWSDRQCCFKSKQGPALGSKIRSPRLQSVYIALARQKHARSPFSSSNSYFCFTMTSKHSPLKGTSFTNKQRMKVYACFLSMSAQPVSAFTSMTKLPFLNIHPKLYFYPK